MGTYLQNNKPKNRSVEFSLFIQTYIKTNQTTTLIIETLIRSQKVKHKAWISLVY